MLPSSHKLAAGEERAELADIFRSHGESYCRTHFLPASQRKVMRAVSVCRTQELGGHLKQCDTAVLSTRPITPAVTATAQNVSRWPSQVAGEAEL